MKDTQTKSESMVLVPARWFESLLADALEFEKANAEYEFGNAANDRVHFKAVSLAGYARSAEHILKHNERVERDKTVPEDDPLQIPTDDIYMFKVRDYTTVLLGRYNSKKIATSYSGETARSTGTIQTGSCGSTN